MKNVAHAWLFDVDGVITHPEQKKVTEPQIFDEIIKRLQSGEPVAFVTGRSLSWMIDRVVNPLKERVEDKSPLQNFFGVGEKGAAWLSYDANGQRVETVDESISTPAYLQDEVRKLIEEQFSDSIFFDDSKRTMISTEMIDGVRLEDYHARQKVFDQKLEELIKQRGLQDRLEVDSTTIATDIQNREVGKDFAARKVLAWLKEKSIKPAQFIAMGDSKSDVPMAQEIHNQGLAVIFVFVGKEADRKHIKSQNLPFPVTFTQNNYEKGTLEYLTSTT